MVLGIRITSHWITNRDTNQRHYPQRLVVNFAIDEGTPANDFVSNREIIDAIKQKKDVHTHVGTFGYDVSKTKAEFRYLSDFFLSAGVGIANLLHLMSAMELARQRPGIKTLHLPFRKPIPLRLYIRTLQHRAAVGSYQNRIFPQTIEQERRFEEVEARLRKRTPKSTQRRKPNAR